MEKENSSECLSPENNETNVGNNEEESEKSKLITNKTENEQISSESTPKVKQDNQKEKNCANNEKDCLENVDLQEVNDQNQSLSLEPMEEEELDYEMAEKEEGTELNQNKKNDECIIEGDIAVINEQSKESLTGPDKDFDNKKPRKLSILGPEDKESSKEVSTPLESNKEFTPVPEAFLCQPCNLIFTNKKFLDQHKDSDDHRHVVKGSKPRGGKYLCCLCWLAFEQSDKLIHHIKMSEHLTRCERKGVKDLFERPGKLQPQWAKDLLAKISTTKSRSRSTSSKRRRSNSSNQTVPTSSTWSHSSKSKDKSHRGSSIARDISNSVRVIRMSDYYEVSSVGHCDLGSGSRPRSLHVTNGLNSSRKEREAGEPPTKKQKTDRSTAMMNDVDKLKIDSSKAKFNVIKKIDVAQNDVKTADEKTAFNKEKEVDYTDEFHVGKDFIDVPQTCKDKFETSTLPEDFENNSVSAQCERVDSAIALDNTEVTAEGKTNNDHNDGDVETTIKENMCIDQTCDDGQSKGNLIINDNSMDMEECIEDS